MASVKGFDPAQTGQKPLDSSGHPVPVGVWGDSTTGVGVFGTSGALTSNQPNIAILNVAGVTGHSAGDVGVRGESIGNWGVVGRSIDNDGVLGVTGIPTHAGVLGVGPGVGVVGFVGGNATGVSGSSKTGIGVFGTSGSGNPDATRSPTGVFGEGLGGSTAIGVYGHSDQGEGVHGESTTNSGVHGLSTSQAGVFGVSQSSDAIIGVSLGTSSNGIVGVGASFGVSGRNFSAQSGAIQGGVQGLSRGGVAVGVLGDSENEDGVRGHCTDAGHAGVAGLNFGSGQGIFGQSTSGLAGDFSGNVRITGTIVKALASSKIDHPLDPKNKYLSHSSVGSPDMLNVYNGNTTTDGNGDAAVTMPDYFEALNRDFRYQLTVIEQFAQAIVASEIKDNRFEIKTDKPHVKVSWMVTGVRHDTYAKAHPVAVEADKPVEERGRYLHPQLWGQPQEAGVVRWISEPQNQLHQVSHLEPEQRIPRLEKLPRPDHARFQEEWQKVERLVQPVGRTAPRK
jgi:hypothetical protein